MKFAAVLRNCVQDLPDTEELFTLYKQLKKSLKRITPAQQGPAVSTSSREDNDLPTTDQHPHDEVAKPNQKQPPADLDNGIAQSDPHQTHPPQATTIAEPEKDNNDVAPTLNPEFEEAFVKAITQDVAALNESYMEKEEVNVIRLGSLEEQAAAASTPQELSAAYRAFIDFHGDLLMVMNWSILAYTGLVKILKKHRKHTGNPVNAPHLENLLSQPFCSVEVTCDMIRSAEGHVAALAERMGIPPPALGGALLPVVGSAGPSETLTSPQQQQKQQNNAQHHHHQTLVQQQTETTNKQQHNEPDQILPSSQQQQQGQKQQAVPELESGQGRGMKRPADTQIQSNERSNHHDNHSHQSLLPPAAPAMSIPIDTKGPEMMNGPAFAGVRRAQAALSMWEQLAHASTPSTCIALQAPGGGGGSSHTAKGQGGMNLQRLQAASDTTNSSAV